MSKKIALVGVPLGAAAATASLLAEVESNLKNHSFNAEHLSLEVTSKLLNGDNEAAAKLQEEAQLHLREARRLTSILIAAGGNSDITAVPVLNYNLGINFTVDSKVGNSFELILPTGAGQFLGQVMLVGEHGTFLAEIQKAEAVSGDSTVKHLGLVLASLQSESATSLRKGGVFKATKEVKKPATQKAVTTNTTGEASPDSDAGGNKTARPKKQPAKKPAAKKPAAKKAPAKQRPVLASTELAAKKPQVRKPSSSTPSSTETPAETGNAATE